MLRVCLVRFLSWDECGYSSVCRGWWGRLGFLVFISINVFGGRRGKCSVGSLSGENKDLMGIFSFLSLFWC